MESEIVKILPALLVSIAGLVIAFRFNKTNLKISEDKLFKELFVELNKRYDDCNSTLEDIATNHKSISYQELKAAFPEKSKKLNDYLNLCAEEYYWHKQGRIPPVVWNSWRAGMNYWYREIQPLKSLWEHELTNGNRSSYYLHEGENFFVTQTKQ